MFHPLPFSPGIVDVELQAADPPERALLESVYLQAEPRLLGLQYGDAGLQSLNLVAGELVNGVFHYNNHWMDVVGSVNVNLMDVPKVEIDITVYDVHIYAHGMGVTVMVIMLVVNIVDVVVDMVRAIKVNVVEVSQVEVDRDVDYVHIDI